MIKISVKLFGAFKKYSEDSIEFEIANHMRIKEFRTVFDSEMKKRFSNFTDSLLISDSAFANETEVLDDAFEINRDTVLAVLPPVCGG